jgi:hypothetical protein
VREVNPLRYSLFVFMNRLLDAIGGALITFYLPKLLEYRSNGAKVRKRVL